MSPAEEQQHRDALAQAFLAAIAEEQRLFELTRAAKPGTPGHDSNLWDRWLKAVDATTAAARAMREGLSPRQR